MDPLQDNISSIALVDSMGDDLAVVNAARVSFAKESEWVETHGWGCGCQDLSEKDAKLIRYLAKHGHWTPFSQVVLKFRIKAPIFVARQWFKHQVGITRNEVSRRYVDDAPEFFTPKEWRGRPDGSIKQGSGGIIPKESLFFGDFEDIPEAYTENGLNQYASNLYNWLLLRGVAPEQARMVLPQSMYTEWVETGSLAAYARVFAQRSDSHAQQEIQAYANALGALVPNSMSVSWEALTNA